MLQDVRLGSLKTMIDPRKVACSVPLTDVPSSLPRLLMSNRGFEWNVRISVDPLLSVDVDRCKRVGDAKTIVSSLFPCLGAESITFVAH